MSTLFKCYKPLIPILTSLISRSQRLIHINHHKISINRVKHCNNGTTKVCCFSSLENRNNVQSSSELWLYNTMSKEKQVLKPKVAGKVGMYVCGVTAYDLSHIGHARVYVCFDVLHWSSLSLSFGAK
ncbi:hypothetical protein HYC85_022627 [Camellia sinensis]|uniref:tRNA synthetases class I catalytic domain-containing protein n=1 Tax=Camellia sinensis TaxID=4442 RepID=A0A7J7GG43_CAMSI|nr:hypothetical protein HYC85_022627 [Camellia sinensis]